MTTAFVCRRRQSIIQRKNHDFGVVDAAGRRVGCTITTWLSDSYVEEIPASMSASTVFTRDRAEAVMAANVEAGRLAVCMQQTRDAKPFGATRSPRYFKTVAEQEAAIAKYLRSAAARARKSVEKDLARRAKRA